MKAALFFLACFLLPATTALPASRPLVLGMDLPEPLAARLEARLRREIGIPPGYIGISVRSITGYDARHQTIQNNELDVIEAGYGLYHEALKGDAWSVILHACYPGDNQQMFYTEGIIISQDPVLPWPGGVRGRTVYAVNPSSATGWQLQSALLDRHSLQVGAVRFVKTHENVAPCVATNPGSIGFCGAFVDIGRYGLSVIARTRRVPGALILVRSSFTAPLVAGLTRCIKDFFFETYRADPVSMRRFYVHPLETEYRKFLDAFERPPSATSAFWVRIIILALVLALVLALWSIHRLKMHLHINRQGYTEVAAELDQGRFSARYKRRVQAHFQHIVRLLARNRWAEALLFMTRDIDWLLPTLIGKINSLQISDTWKMHLTKQVDPGALIAGINKRIAEQLRSLLIRSRMQSTGGLDYSDILSTEEQCLIPLATIDGPLLTINGYRLLVEPEHPRFCTEQAARHVFDAWLILQRNLSQSGLFA